MSELGCDFICSKSGFWKLLVIVSGGTCWGLYVASEAYRSPSIKTYVLVAYLISWVVTLVTYVMKVTGVYLHIQSECLPFSTFDYFWSWISCINYISSSIILACFFEDKDPLCRRQKGFCKQARQLTALLLGFFTAILYALEARNLKVFAPVGVGYGTTWRGIWKAIILVVGGVAFGLLLQTRRCTSSGNKDVCTIVRTAVLIIWCSAWGVAALLYLIRLLTCPSRRSPDRHTAWGSFEFFWSAFACVLYLIGAAVFAGFLECSTDEFRTRRNCRIRLASDLCGFVTAIFFAIDAYYLRDRRPVWLVKKRRVQSRDGGREVVTTVTTQRRTATT